MQSVKCFAEKIVSNDTRWIARDNFLRSFCRESNANALDKHEAGKSSDVNLCSRVKSAFFSFFSRFAQRIVHFGRNLWHCQWKSCSYRKEGWKYFWHEMQNSEIGWKWVALRSFRPPCYSRSPDLCAPIRARSVFRKWKFLLHALGDTFGRVFVPWIMAQTTF